MMPDRTWLPVVLLLLLFPGGPAAAYEVSETLSINGIAAGVYQYQRVISSDKDQGRGAGSFQAEIQYTPAPADMFFMKLGFAAGNGLNDGTAPFSLAPWAASLEDDVEDINGRSRDYLLSAWYRHTFTFAAGRQLALTAGIIDATDYLDENAFANDEYTQFMNEALVNGPLAFLPSFDFGGAVEWNHDPFAVKLVAMSVGENDRGDNFKFYGGQIGYAGQSPLGAGNYRVIAGGTTEDFRGPAGIEPARLAALLLSCDQELGENFGVWTRLGWGSTDAAVVWKRMFSGGLNISGSGWQRPHDAVGLGYAFLGGGNQEIDSSEVLEIYYRLELNRYLAAAADIQYIRDSLKTNSDAAGWIFGIRLTAQL